MRIEINQPRPEINKESRTKSKIKNFFRGFVFLGLALGLNSESEEYFDKQEQQTLTQELSEKNLAEITETQPELFQGSPEQIWQQAIDNPQEFILQQGLSSEYQDFELKKELDLLVQNQVGTIFDTHHQNLKELTKLFRYVDNAAPIIIKEAQEQGIPYGIALGIAMHESKCNPNAHDSIKGASGLFQLKKKTAESLGLKVNRKIDERLDPVKSTRAGLSYLKRQYERFGRWDLALVAYNRGPTKFNHYLASIQEKPGQPLLEKVDIQNLQEEEVTYLCLHQSYSEQNKYPLNVEANIRLYLWYVYEKASREQDLLAKK
ncbi:MAG: transglycosylase SLT domain-containing protein [Patescibacteria group bacterium]|nr:transglycosylase SLT domain-containing protein [Patescibacteria group bacterium]